MKNSSDRILTTHVGSLPRPQRVADLIFAKERDEDYDRTEFDQSIAEGVTEAVTRQVDAGIDVVSDGEMSKISYATYIKERISGFEGDSPRSPPQDLQDFPSFLERLAKTGGTPAYQRPKCTGEIRATNSEPLEKDLKNFHAALHNANFTEGFMNSASPGVIALFQPNEYYPGHEQYLEALAEAMRVEYEGIVDAGFLLQLDSPDLGLGRHMMFADKSEEDYQRLAGVHVEVLNHALRNIPADRVRMHVCWGNYEGPHHYDAPMSLVLPIVLQANIGALLFEASNPRHAHEWTTFRDTELPDDLILIPGVIDSTTNFVEHPELVAERICRFADIVGRERVIAGSDCGFATFAGFGAVDGEIAYAKLATMATGARIASDRLWG
ncbi:MAG: cobalamin-independent methionine synthase II family protein [Proteobacteria bacterium]|nr:cobalamin-independent methionine synthase II family protein [Pseudomonadota bacterium]